MGVYPEPALCADDVSRLAPIGSHCNEAAAGRMPRHQAPERARTTRLPRLGATLVLGAALGGLLCQGVSTSALARDGGEAALRAAQTRSDLSVDHKRSEWGGVPLLDQESAAAAIVASSPKESEDEILRFGTMSVPRALVETILRAAEATGVDPVYMMALADKESSFDTDVKSSASSAQGLFQFVTATWLEMVRDYGAAHGLAAEAAAVTGRGGAITISDPAVRKRVLDLRNDAYVSGLMAGELIKRDRARIEARIGRELKTTELYLAHFLGTASAGKFLTLSEGEPDTKATSAFGRAARANRSLFTAKDGPKRRSLTVAEVHERLDGMIDRRMSQYEGIAALAAQAGEAAESRPAEAPVLDARLRTTPDVVPALAEAPTVQ